MATPNPAAVFRPPAQRNGRKAAERPSLVVELPTGPVVITVEDVDPDTAEAWLDPETVNTHNRTKQDDRVAALARDMESGAWVFNGDTIRFCIDDNGKTFLGDGQHRLAAIVASDTVQPCLIVRGLPDAAQEVIDTGKVRTFGDSLKLDGWSDENHIGAITRMLLLWDERNTVLGVVQPGALRRGGGGGGARALTTKPELYAYLRGHEQEIRDSLKIVKAAGSTGLKFAAPASKLAAAWVLCSRRDAAAAELFIVEHVIQGKHLDDGHPAKALRDRLLRTDVYKPAPGTAFMLTLHAWNHWRRGNLDVDRLQPPRVWAKPQDFGIL
jgi:hypothetical protein